MPLSPESHLSWFRAGCRAALSVPGFILLAAFVGFAGLANAAGFTLAQTLFTVLTIWALPSMVVLVGSVQNGLSLPATALAVALSAVRLMPMVVALVPEMRDTKTRRVTLYFLSHFIAVTSWVMSFQRFPDIPREQRTSFYAGLAAMLMVMNLAVVAVVHPLAKELPPTLSALLLFLTPMYFLTSLWGSAREIAGAYAMLLGLVLGPICHVLVPQADLLVSGLVGGALAYGLQRWQQGRRGA
jgi:predicted branched-subunit amino acid permease